MQLPKGIKRTYSKKLFYDKYLYKIQLLTKAGRYFRFELPRLKNLLKDRYIRNIQKYADLGLGYHDDNPSDTLNYTYQIIDVLIKHKDFKICSSQDGIFVYTDEESFIHELIAIDNKQVKIVAYPDPKVAHLLVKNVIFSYEPFKYKVTFRKLEKNGKDFVTWCKQMGGYNINYAGEYYLSKYDRWHDFYVYVEDDNFLTMLKLYVDENEIRRIDRIEYPHIRKSDEVDTPSV